MKRWLIYLAGILLIILFQWMPFHGTDIAKLLPVELIRLSYEEGQILLETDEGYYGRGDTIAQALGDLENTTPGTVFLETADYLIVDPDAIDLIDDIAPHLRPACGICKCSSVEKLDEAAAFLSAHEPDLTVRDWMGGESNLPKLLYKDGRSELVQ